MRILSGLVAALLLTALLAVSSPAHAAKGRQCEPRPAQQSLIVKGKTSCRKVDRIINGIRELALHVSVEGADTFSSDGYVCKLRKGDHRRFTCRDANGQPKRSFAWVDRT